MPNQLTKLMLAGILSCGACGAVYATEAQTAQAPAQTVTCTGTVYDSTGEPVIGASVIVKGAGTGAATNIDGEFSLKGVKIGDEITVTYIGCDPYTFKVTGSEPVSITLKENAHNLDEVVVTALGMKREKKALGYAVTELKGEELNTNLVNPVSALQGKVAGVNINQSDGGIFGSNKIEIRGASTLSSNNQPIYVVDGIILDNSVHESSADWNGDSNDYGNELKNLNPADFESVSVLKGAAATALYGSRGLNGVVVITTKSGKGSRGYGVTVTQTLGCDWHISTPGLNYEFGAGGLPGNVKYGDDRWYNHLGLNADGKPSLIQSSGSGWGVPYSEYEGELVEYYDGSYRPYRAYKDNYKNAYRTGFNSTTNVAVTGGNETTNFYLSAGYKYAQGTIAENDFKRYNMLLKASHQVSKTVNVEAGVTFANSKPRNAQINLGEQFVYGSLAPWVDVASEKNDYKGAHGGLPQITDKNYYNVANSLWWGINENNTYRKETVIRPNAKVTITPLDWMRITAEGSFNYYYVRGEVRNPGTNAALDNGYYEMSQSTKEQTNLNLTMNLNKEWGDFETHAMLRGEYYHSWNQSMKAWTDGGLTIPNKFFITNSKNPYKSTAELGGRKTMWSAMAQIGASWKGQVYLDVTGRNDWSSALVYSDAHGTYSYFYPSVSASWLADNTFREYLPWWVSMAKFRASWAQVGNDTDPYSINTAYGFVNAPHNGSNIPVVTPTSTAYSQNLKPERKTSWEFGIDWRFVNNRFGIDFAYYKENTKDQIMSIPVPSVAGISRKLVNAGNIQNSGIEIALNTTPIETKDWTWDVNLTFTRNRSKIISLHPDAGEYYSLSGDVAYGNFRTGSVAKVGGAYGLIMSDSYQKIDEESGLPVFGWTSAYTSVFGIREGEVKDHGHDINPDFLGSMSTSLRWKNLRLNVSIDGRWGGYVASYDSRYGAGEGLTEGSLKWRNKAHGGVEYTSMWNGKKYEDGVIPNGILLTGRTIEQPDGSVYTVGTGQYSSGETFAELMAKGVVEPVHAGAYHYWMNSWSNGVVTDEWFQKLNYVALREVSLSYTLPQNIASKIGSRGITLTATGHNLGYLHNSLNNNINPESVRSTSSHEFRIRGYEGTTASFTFTVNAQF